MARFSLEEVTYNNIFTYCLIDSETGSVASIASYGANLYSLQLRRDGAPFELIDGYKNKEELCAGAMAKSRVMAPFANRIHKNEYLWEGKQYIADYAPFISHGFLGNCEFILQSYSSNNEYAEVTLAAPEPTEAQKKAYPFSISFSVCYRLSAQKIEVWFSVVNNEKSAIPFFCGWHPYFTFNFRPIAECLLEHNADTEILIDSNYIPFPGNNAYKKIAPGETADFTGKRRPGVELLNKCLLKANSIAHSEKKSDELCTVFTSPEDKLELIMVQPYGVLYLFDGRSNEADISYSLAIEPVESITNSFNRSDRFDYINLNAGCNRKFKATVQWKEI